MAGIRYLFIFLYFNFYIFYANVSFPDSWEDITDGLVDGQFNDIELAKNRGTFYLYVAGTKGLYYRNINRKNGWKVLFMSRGTGGSINDVIAEDGQIIIATSYGLYYSSDSGTSWRRIFKKEGKKARCNYIIKDIYGRFYLGTEDGLFYSDSLYGSWDYFQYLNNKHVTSITVDDDRTVYVIGDNNLYKIDIEKGRYYKIFDNSYFEYKKDAEDDENFWEKDTRIMVLNRILEHNNTLYLSTSKGLFTSKDGGINWHRFNNNGLQTTNISDCIVTKDGVFVAGEKGCFFYNRKNNKWQPLYKGIDVIGVKELLFDNEAGIYALTKNRVYKMIYNSSTHHNYNIDGEINQLLHLKNEPTINEVQKMAIYYAEVYPEKIKKWRKSAKFKALLPTISFGIDNAISDTYEIYTSSSKSYWIYGPEDRTTGWDIDFRWNLSELIWNEDQVQIDVRSRLMVQLRDDIIDEVNRLYFERRRLQIELLLNPPHERKQLIEKRLRIQELTAGLDGLTGGAFSKAIDEYSRVFK